MHFISKKWTVLPKFKADYTALRKVVFMTVSNHGLLDVSTAIKIMHFKETLFAMIL